MGRVRTRLRIQSFSDILAVHEGKLTEDRIRSVEVDGLVDTGASTLCAPSSIIRQLGLLALETRRFLTANGAVERTLYGGAVVTLLGRSVETQVAEIPEGMPVLIGVTVLELLDFVVDPVGERLIPNPEHGGEWMLDMY